MKFSFLYQIERNNTPLDLFPQSLDSSTLCLRLALLLSLCMRVVSDLTSLFVLRFWVLSAADLLLFLSLAVYLPLVSGCIHVIFPVKNEKYFPSFLWTFVMVSEIHVLLFYPFYISLSWSIKVTSFKGFLYRIPLLFRIYACARDLFTCLILSVFPFFGLDIFPFANSPSPPQTTRN